MLNRLWNWLSFTSAYDRCHLMLHDLIERITHHVWIGDRLFDYDNVYTSLDPFERAYRSIHLKTQFHRAQDMHSIHDCSAHKQSRVVLFTWMTVCTSPWCQLYTTRVTSHTHTKVGRLISTRLRRHRVISLRNTTDRYIAELSFAVCH